MVSEIVTLVGELGFPILAFLLMYRYAFVAIERNTKAMRRLAATLKENQPGEPPDWVKEYKDGKTVSPIPLVNKLK